MADGCCAVCPLAAERMHDMGGSWPVAVFCSITGKGEWHNNLCTGGRLAMWAEGAKMVLEAVRIEDVSPGTRHIVENALRELESIYRLYPNQKDS